MPRAWLIVPPPAGRHAHAFSGLERVVDVGAFGLDVAVPVACGSSATVNAVARGIEGARVADEDDLARAVAERVTAIKVGRDNGVLVVNDGVRVGREDVKAIVALVTADGPAVCIVRRGGGTIVVARAVTDLAPLLPDVERDEAFGRFVGGLPSLLGHSVDNLVPAGSALTNIVTDLLDVPDLVAHAKALAPSPTTKAAQAAAAAAQAPLDPAELQPKKCQACGEIVPVGEGYTVFDEPMCAACAQPYAYGHRQRAAVLGGIFVGAVAAFVGLTASLGVAGRVLGVTLVLSVLRTVIATGVQYDVDVDSGVGRARKGLRKAGWFKRWADLDRQWWGKWLVRRGLLVGLGLLGLFIPLGIADKDAVDDDVAAEVVDTSILLRPLSGVAKHDDLVLELVEIRVDGGRTTAVLDVTKGTKSRQLILSLGDDPAQNTYGVPWWIVHVDVPPDPPALRVRFDPPPEH